MNIYCRICGEEWDMDSIHEEISERIATGLLPVLPPNGDYRPGPVYDAYQKAYAAHYSTVRDEFYSNGCAAFHALLGSTPSDCKPQPKSPDGQLTRAEGMAVLIDLLGDDLDGIASMMDDYDFAD